MNSLKRVSAEEIINFAKSEGSNSDDMIVDWNGAEIHVKRLLDIDDMFDYINSVVESCFTDDGQFAPHLKDYAKKKIMIQTYTNIDLPSDSNKCIELIYGTTLTDAVSSVIYKSQYDQMVEAIDSIISYRLYTETKFVEREMDKVSNSLTDIVNSMDELFGGVTPDDLNGLFKAVQGGQIDEQKIVEAYIHQTKVDD